jgi:hypothetical protein
MRRSLGLLLVALLLAAAAPTSAGAAQTFGSTLPSGSLDPEGCSGGDPCTASLETTAGGAQARAPIDGIIVRWRLRTNAAYAGSVRLRILRDQGGNDWRFVRSGAPSPITATTGIHTFAARVPVTAGDYIGLDRPDTMEQIFRSAAGAVSNLFSGTPPPDDDSRNNAGSPDRELLINADVEPDADRDGFGDESQDLCPIDPFIQGLCPQPPALAAPAAPAADRSAPRVRLSFARTQDIDKLAVVVRTSEAGRVSGRGSVQTTRRRLRTAAVLRLRGASRRMSRRGRVRLRLLLARRPRARVKRLLLRRGRAVARVAVTATDLAGNSRRVTRRIKLRP